MQDSASHSRQNFTDGEIVTERDLDDLDAERDVVDRIRQVHRKHIDAATDLAERLAAQVGEFTDDGGIRDLVDEDAEVDAAIRAAQVRQHSAQAMNAYRRANELRSMGDAVAFGHTTADDGERTPVGKISVIDGDDVLLIDWRAPAAAPFYRATPLDRLGVRHRRHLLYGDDAPDVTPELIGYSDEVFGFEGLADTAGLRGEAAILASVEAPTAEQMRSVVATIQAEQDAIIRAPSDRPLVVQGAPGTGKTVVALHRAAYLLYDQRSALAETGVLIVGPTTEFLSWIAEVLPSLGESGVVSVTAPQLYPGVRMGQVDSDEVADIKGRIEMVGLLSKAVADRARRPAGPLTALYGSNRVRLSVESLVNIFERARRQRTHNGGAAAFREGVIDALAAEVYNPAFANLEDARANFSDSPDVEHFLLRHWPTLSAEQALNDLLGSPALLRSAAFGLGLGRRRIALLERERTSEVDLDNRRWSPADIPLLDELLALLGPVYGSDFESDRIVERDAADDFELEQDRGDDWDDDADEDPDEFADDVDNISIWDIAAAEEAGA